MLKQTNTKFKRRALFAGLVAAAITAIVPSAKTSAYGPARDFYTPDKPADHALFNSICYGTVRDDGSCEIDPNLQIGSEMNFVRVREKDTDAWLDEVYVEPGKDYEVWVFYHNDASATYNDSEHHGVGIAQNVRMYSNFDKVVSSNQNATVSGIITWLDSEGNVPAAPFDKGIWDEAYFKTNSERDIVLSYVNDSATYHTKEDKWPTNNMKVPTALFDYSSDVKELGVKLGLGIAALGSGEEVTQANGYDGIIPGCDEYMGWITYTVHADQPGATLNKRVSKDGENWVEEITDAKPGDKIYYKIEWCNTGTTTQNGVTFKDQLPPHVKLIEGTTKVKKDGYDEVIDNDNAIDKGGIIAGTFAAGECVSITYETKIDEGLADSDDCATTLVNTAYVYDENGGGTASAKIIVKVDCTVPELPKTGPGEIALSLVAVICVTVGIIYWYYSQKELAALNQSAAPTETKTPSEHKSHKDDK